MASRWVAVAAAAWFAAYLPPLHVVQAEGEEVFFGDHFAPRPSTDHPTFVLMDDFDIEQYIGSWHEVYSTGHVNNCSTHVFSTASSTVTYFEKEYNASTASYLSRQGSAQLVANAMLLIRRPGTTLPVYNYWIVDTDYDTFAVVYINAMGWNSAGSARVFSRDYVLPSRAAARVDAVLLGRFNLTLAANLSAANNEGCIPDVCPPVGPTAQYLDPNRLAGRWYQVTLQYRYPPRTALRWCPNWLITPAPNESLFLQPEMPSPVPHEDLSPVRLPALEVRPKELLSGDGEYFARLRLAGGARAMVQFNILNVNYESWALVSVCNSTLMRNSTDLAVERYTMLLARYPVVESVPLLELEETENLHDLHDLTNETTSSLSCPPPRCPDWLPVKTPFEQDKFLGTWFVMYEGSPTLTPATAAFCVKHRLRKPSRDDENDYALLDVIQYTRNTKGPQVTSVTLSLPRNSSEGKYHIEAPGLADDQDTLDHYWVLETDYKHFAVAYSCSGFRKERVWVLSRKLGLSWTATRHVLDVLVKGHVDLRSLTQVDWPGFCATAPDPYNPDADADDDGGGGAEPASSRAPRTTRMPCRVAVIMTILAVLVASRLQWSR